MGVAAGISGVAARVARRMRARSGFVAGIGLVGGLSYDIVTDPVAISRQRFSRAAGCWLLQVAIIFVDDRLDAIRGLTLRKWLPHPVEG